MKFVISLLAVFILIVIGVPALKVNAQVDISNTPNEWQLGTISASSVHQTGLDHFTVTNNSGYDIRITIRGSDMNGAGATWTLSDDASQGTDIYGLKAGLYEIDGGSYNVTVNKTDTVLIDNLPDTSSRQWGLQFLAPAEFTDGAEKSGTVTLTATLP